MLFMRLRSVSTCRLAVLAAALWALQAPVQAADVVPVNADNTVSLNFANADIESVISAIGKISGKNFLIDPRVKGTLNIITNTPVSRDLSYQILLSALRLQGYTAVEGGGVIKIVPEADAKLHGVPVGKDNRVQGESLVTQVFPMRHESASQMLAVIRPLVSPNNTVTAFPSNNVLVVTDYADNLRRIAQIIESVDVPQGDVTVIDLRYAVAADLAATVGKLLNDGLGATAQGAAGGGDTQRVNIVAEPRTNSLLVQAANPSRLRAVRQLVASLDKPGAGGNIHVVYLRNAEAEKVARTLNAALSGEQSLSLGSDGRSGNALNFASGSDTASTTSSGTGSNSGTTQDGRSLSLTSGTTTNAVGSGTGGIVQADVLNNALIIVAPDAVYRNIRHVIDQLDRRRAQVYIEALVAEISSDRAAEFGIQWQTSNLPGSGSGGFAGTNFGGVGQNIISATADPSSLGAGLNFVIGRGTVKIPINGEMVEVFNLGLLARFLESDARTNILSTPTIVTLDNEAAKIMVGRNVPFITGQYTTTGTTSSAVNPFQTIERQDVGLTLEVRPQISEGGTVKLDIYQEASSLATAVDSTNGPTTNKRSIRSTVLVDDGAIVALGGLVEDSYSGGEEKVPLLGDIPYAGALFRYDTRKRTKTNLVVFLRPVIIRDAEAHAAITSTRYDYVIGKQRDSASRITLANEGAPPQLPPRPVTQYQREDGPAPVRDAEVIRVGGATAP